MLTPNELVTPYTFGVCYLCATFSENRLRNVTVSLESAHRPTEWQTDRQTDTQTDTMHAQRQTEFITCPILCAIVSK